MKDAYAARFASDGADVVVKDFDRVGRAGERAGRDIAKGAKGISPAMRGIDTAVGEARKGLDGFAGRAGAFGGILQSMGPLGLAAAAGIGAMGAAFSVAVSKGTQAIEWAESLELLSERLNTSARSVQEWRFAASQFGVDAGKTDAALEKLNNTIGLASRDIPKAVKLFKALGFDDVQIRNFTDVNSVLPQIAEKLAALAPAARAGLANKLGLSELLPLLRDGSAGIEDFKKQFQELGLVIDEGALRRAAEDNDRLDIATARAEAATQRMSLALTGAASAWGEFGAASSEAFEEIFANFQKLEDRSTRVLRKQLEAEEAAVAGSRFGYNSYSGQEAIRLRTELLKREPEGRAASRRKTAELIAARQGRRNSALEDTTEDPKGTPKSDPVRAMLESRIKTMREAQAAAAGLAAVERDNPGLTQDEVKARYDLLQAYKLIDEARKAGVIASDAEAQSLRDSIAADQAKAASLKERDAAQRIADERLGRADNVRQFFETPLMRMKREIAEIEDLRRGGELGDDEARRSVADLRKEYEELARAQFEASDAGQLFGGILKGQIRNIGDFKAALLSLLQQRLMDKLFGQLGKLGDSLGGLAGAGSSKGGIGGLLSKGIGLLFGGARAGGGPAMPGQFYKINEATANSEYFAPSVPGTIFNAAQMDALMSRQNAGGGSFAPVFAPVIDARNADSAAVTRLEGVIQAQQRQFEAWTASFSGNVLSVVTDAKARRHPVFR